MKCVNCKNVVGKGMAHAIGMNSCPFCGKNIFTSDEFDFRKDFIRILVRNGVDDETQIHTIVNDIASYINLKSGRETPEEARQAEQVSGEVQEDGSVLTGKARSEGVTAGDLEGDNQEPDPEDVRAAQEMGAVFSGNNESDEIRRRKAALKLAREKGVGVVKNKPITRVGE